MCWLSPGSETLHPDPVSAKHNNQSRAERRFQADWKLPMSKRTDLGNCLQRDNTDFQIFTDFPWLCPLLTLQLHVQPQARHSKGHDMPRVQPGKRQQCITGLNYCCKKTLLYWTHVSKLTTDGHIWVSSGLWLLRFQDMQSSSVLLPDPFLGPGKTVACSSSDCFSMEFKQQLAVKKSYCQMILRSLCKKLSVKGSYSFLEQGSRQECNTALEQINLRAVSRLTWLLGRTTHLQLSHRPYRGTPSILLLWWREVRWDYEESIITAVPPLRGSHHLCTKAHTSPLQELHKSCCPHKDVILPMHWALCAAVLLLPDPEPTFLPFPLSPAEHHCFPRMQFIRESDWKATILGVGMQR